MRAFSVLKKRLFNNVKGVINYNKQLLLKYILIHSNYTNITSCILYLYTINIVDYNIRIYDDSIRVLSIYRT